MNIPTEIMIEKTAVSAESVNAPNRTGRQQQKVYMAGVSGVD
jgi:hypothetical protein